MNIIHTPLPNNGNVLAEYFQQNEINVDGLTTDQIAEIARPLMLKAHHLDNDDFWEDFLYRAEELGMKIKV